MEGVKRQIRLRRTSIAPVSQEIAHCIQADSTLKDAIRPFRKSGQADCFKLNPLDLPFAAATGAVATAAITHCRRYRSLAFKTRGGQRRKQIGPGRTGTIVTDFWSRRIAGSEPSCIVDG